MNRIEFKVGDLICEKELPECLGIVVEIIASRKKDAGLYQKLVVQWQTPNPRSTRALNIPEILDSFYLVLVNRNGQ